MDINKVKKYYFVSQCEEKRKILINLLQPLLGKGENFDMIYEYMLLENIDVNEGDLDEVFGILEKMYMSVEEKSQHNMGLKMQNLLQKIKQQEEQDTIHERKREMIFDF